ncbi:MAG TPA: hypothetical protein VKR58_10495, partial [Aquella sp.]|nr:hypothetical protein [Aquella sp.]
YSYLSDKNPFSEIESTEWKGDENIYMILRYVKENNLMILSVNEFSIFQLNKWDHLYSQSEYSEKFKKAFKDFDKNNRYKELKFGIQKQEVIKKVRIEGPDQFKQYGVLNKDYKIWFYINFDECDLTFNRKRQLYNVSLYKAEYSNDDYEIFVNDAIKLFGSPTELRKMGDKIETTQWLGNNLYLAIMRHQSGSLSVMLDALEFDDSSPTDKLY